MKNSHRTCIWQYTEFVTHMYYIMFYFFFKFLYVLTDVYRNTYGVSNITPGFPPKSFEGEMGE